jgi:hypothetical protein
MNNIQFARNLVKGRIAETIFAQMLRDTQNFTVLEFGYEKVIPDLVGFGSNHNNPVIETLRVAPDFAVINRTTKEVRLIEVKYRKELNQSEVLECARKMHASWNPSFLFIATLEGFFFDEVSDIIAHNGHIAALQSSLVAHELQENYLKILSDFEKAN